MGIVRKAKRMVFKLALIGAISAAGKYLGDIKQGGARRKKLLGLLGK